MKIGKIHEKEEMILQPEIFTEEETRPLIKSISFSQTAILKSIIYLYLPGGKIQVDPCYNKGGFYQSGEIPEPDYIFDIEESYEKPETRDCRNLPYFDNVINSIIFDPPFLTYPGKKLIKGMKRFGSFRTQRELSRMYRQSEKEFYRVLRPGGILIVKCQDGTYGPYFVCTHVNDVINPCVELGFRQLDLFILLSKGRAENRKGTQRMSRKYHSYFIVFEKGKK